VDRRAALGNQPHTRFGLLRFLEAFDRLSQGGSHRRDFMFSRGDKTALVMIYNFNIIKYFVLKWYKKSTFPCNGFDHQKIKPK